MRTTPALRLARACSFAFGALMLVASAAGLASSGDSLRPFLGEDGRLDLPDDFVGSLNPAGYRMVQDVDGSPRFLPTAKPEGESATHKLFGVAGGCNGAIRALARAADGMIYLGGEFTACENLPANGIVAYDPLVRRFSVLDSDRGNGVNGKVFAIAAQGTDIYVGGQFYFGSGAETPPIVNIARWDGRRWHGIGSGIDFPVLAIAVNANELYVGGEFREAGLFPATGLARWDGENWTRLGNNETNQFGDTVRALSLDDDYLYVGGRFDQIGDVAAKNIARWDGSSWSNLGTDSCDGVSKDTGSDPGYFIGVYALARKGAELYVGGDFDAAGCAAASNAAVWNGTAWSTLGDGFNANVFSLAVVDDQLLAGGSFTSSGDLSLQWLAGWNGQRWSSVATTGVNSVVHALTDSVDGLIVGGSMTLAGTVPVRNVALLNGDRWSALAGAGGSGVFGDVYALAVQGSDLYVGGSFHQAGGVAVRNIARWNGSTWSSLGVGAENGVDNSAYALAVLGSDLYVGGLFNYAGTQLVRSITRWDGSAWHPIGDESGIGLSSSFRPYVSAFAVHGPVLYVGGSFNLAGNVPASSVAQWDGARWSALGESNNQGIRGSVDALVVYEDDLYLGGAFGGAGPLVTPGVALWNGNQWSALGSGLNNYVRALAATSNGVYAAGTFSQPGRGIAHWDGTRWSALANEPGGAEPIGITTLAAHGDTLYAAGDFIGDTEFARWSGDRWQAMPIGTPTARLRTLSVTDAGIFADGLGLLQTAPPQLASGTSAGVAGGAANQPAINRYGGKIAFSTAAKLSDADQDTLYDVYVYDRIRAETRLISSNAQPSGGTEMQSFTEPSLSLDGATTAYVGSAGQVYVATPNGIKLASASAEGIAGNGPSMEPAVVGYGSQVLFTSHASNLIADASSHTEGEVYLKNLNSGAIERLSVSATGEPANGGSSQPASSSDGRTLAFITRATNLVPSDPSNEESSVRQAVLYTGPAESRQRVYLSRNPDSGELGNSDSASPQLSADGRFGVFASAASNLVEGDTNGVSDVFRFELQNGSVVTLERVSVSTFDIEGNGPSIRPSISDDGQIVSFQSDASNLVGLDSEGHRDIMLKSMATGELVRLSRSAGSSAPNGDSDSAAISGDGSVVAFSSLANNLMASDDNDAFDVFAVLIGSTNPALVAGSSDEPTFTQLILPAPDPANANCPAGYFVALVDDGPGAGFKPGIFGLELLLDEPGERTFQGGLNFGGVVDRSQVGFAGFNITNPNGEDQRLNLQLSATPWDSSTESLALQVRILRQDASSSTVVYESAYRYPSSSPLRANVDLPPGYYVATVGTIDGDLAGAPEGKFQFSVNTRFVDRPGGGFQGGAVIGGYHAQLQGDDVSAFAAFCLGTPHSLSARLLSAPSYGESGAGDLRLRVRDALEQRDLIVLPSF